MRTLAVTPTVWSILAKNSTAILVLGGFGP